MSLTNRELLTFGAKRSRYSSGLSISGDPEGSPRSAGNLRLMAHRVCVIYRLPER